MRKPDFQSAHEKDGQGRPAGGKTVGLGFEINWQTARWATASRPARSSRT